MGIKQMLLSILGEKRYLSMLAGTFQRLYPTGWLGSNYQDVYFLKHIIEPGAYCGDIGAHLGYYTIALSRLVGPSGKVIAVEPMPAFNSTLTKLLRAKTAVNVELHQVALGGGSEFVEMGIPKVGAMKRFAYARVKESSEHLEYIESVKVKNLTGDEMFGRLPRLDFIKCDVEGLEVPVFRSAMAVLRTHHPILLCELADKAERIKMYEMLQPLGYETFRLENGRLYALDVYSDQLAISHNHYFIPARHRERLKGLIG
jgi:FkbM family methyltransferase